MFSIEHVRLEIVNALEAWFYMIAFGIWGILQQQLQPTSS